MIDTVTDAGFEADVIASTTPILVELGASWCPPCRPWPVLTQLAREREGSLRWSPSIPTPSPDRRPLRRDVGPTLLLFSEASSSTAWWATRQAEASPHRGRDARGARRGSLTAPVRLARDPRRAVSSLRLARTPR